MDINDQINEALEAAAEHRQAAEERPDLAREMLMAARADYRRAIELLDSEIAEDAQVMNQLESGKPGA